MEISKTYRTALVDFLFQLADDELVAGHRNSEWLGLAPDIEEDVAFSSLAQAEIGHATFYYELLEMIAEGKADALAFERDSVSRRNACLLEAENGDWATTIARHYFYDLFETVRLRALIDSSFEPLRLGAAKIIREEHYHILHMETWFKRLAQGGQEARSKLLSAVNQLWNELTDLFSLGAHTDTLVSEGIITKDSGQLLEEWATHLKSVFEEVAFDWPGLPNSSETGGRLGKHTATLTDLLDTMGEVYRIQPGVKW